MCKVVLNKCFGGFTLSREAVLWLYNNCEDCNLRKHINDTYRIRKSFCYKDPYKSMVYTVSDWFKSNRHHNDLVAVVEKLGTRASGDRSQLSIEEACSDHYFIEERDGFESLKNSSKSC